MAQYQLGAQLYTVRETLKNTADMRTSLKKVAEMGYHAVQLSGHSGLSPGDLADALEENGLTASATHTAWDRCLKDLDSVIKEHKMWKCPHVGIGSLPADYRNRGGIDRFLEELTPIARSLAAEGMDFSYHNHSQELAKVDGRTWLETLYERANPALLKAEIDVYWIQHGGGDPAEWIRKLSGRQSLIHLKDMIVTPERVQRFAAIGQGNLNWPRILQEAKNAGVEWYLVEQDDCYGADPFECLSDSYNFLKNMGYR